MAQPVLIDPVEVERPRASAAVGKVLPAYAPEQALLLPPSLDDWLPAGHLARFVGEVVDEHLDLSVFYAAHTVLKGAPPYEPRLLLKVLLYGYATGVTSSRRLEGAARRMSRSGSWLATSRRRIGPSPAFAPAIWRR